MLELKCGGLLLDRHEPPLTRRFVVYFCSAVYTCGTLENGHETMPSASRAKDTKNEGLIELVDVQAEATVLGSILSHGAPAYNAVHQNGLERENFQGLESTVFSFR